MYVCMYVCMYVFMYVCMYAWMGGWMCVYVCMSVTHVVCRSNLMILTLSCTLASVRTVEWRNRGCHLCTLGRLRLGYLPDEVVDYSPFHKHYPQGKIVSQSISVPEEAVLQLPGKLWGINFRGTASKNNCPLSATPPPQKLWILR